jgi:hypothetical protein
VRSLREELTWAARESRRVSKDAAADVRDQARQTGQDARGEAKRIRDEVREQVKQAAEEARGASRQAREAGAATGRAAGSTTGRAGDPATGRTDDTAADGARGRLTGGADLGSDAARRVHEQAQRLREEAASARFRSGSGEQAWEGPGDGPGWSGWTDWPGRRGGDDRSRTRGRHGWSGPLDFGTFRDLERLAVQFTTDLRKLAMQSSSAGENVITDLRTILEEALDRIKSEIFGPGHSPDAAEQQAEDSPQQD